MNASQKKYLIKRIDDLVIEKKNQVRKEATTLPTTLETNQRIDLIVKGKVKLKKAKELKKLSTWQLAEIKFIYDFSKYEQAKGVNEKLIERKTNIIIGKSLELKDTIMIGEEKDALRLLKEFTDL